MLSQASSGNSSLSDRLLLFDLAVTLLARVQWGLQMSSKLVLMLLTAGAIVGERSEKLLLDATACSPSPKSEALNPPSEALEGARALGTQC